MDQGPRMARVHCQRTIEPDLACFEDMVSRRHVSILPPEVTAGSRARFQFRDAIDLRREQQGWREVRGGLQRQVTELSCPGEIIAEVGDSCEPEVGLCLTLRLSSSFCKLLPGVFQLPFAELKNALVKKQAFGRRCGQIQGFLIMAFRSVKVAFFTEAVPDQSIYGGLHMTFSTAMCQYPTRRAIEADVTECQCQVQLGFLSYSIDLI
jgi:hypothetical protein